ncbi:NAD(P)-binding protein [Cylindrobasidium torrendii FP15055 ss-10]|uniref:NAD(P)-binding protein n=1 Tax=Cylindrobasidium torrendii FP15055 ss-10 TaxID=1314674 RepID=A0A0D7BIE4_9AGAR|nr:NAD(P)-binding protein [Cylindrobasidium torrendii FP15055 ss-10]
MSSDLFNVSGRVALITGGGQGLGEHMAEGLVKNGAKVYITGRTESTLKRTTEALNAIKPGAAKYCVCDIGKKEDLEKLVGFVKQYETRLDILIQNAGTAAFDMPSPENDISGSMDMPNPFPITASLDPSQWEEQFRAYCWSPYALVCMALPLLAEAAKLGEGRGSVIMITSIAARFFNPWWRVPAYSSAKAGMEHLSKIIGARVYPYGVRVNCIAPGSFPSAVNLPDNPYAMSNPENDKRIPLGRSGTADDIVGGMLFFASRASAYVTGQFMDIDGGAMLVANGTNKIAP